jgi:hypothetical protein
VLQLKGTSSSPRMLSRLRPLCPCRHWSMHLFGFVVTAARPQCVTTSPVSPLHTTSVGSMDTCRY